MLAARAAASAALRTKSHYDGTLENRAKGAAAYNFSQDEATRQEQMEALKRDRYETEEMRGAIAAGRVLTERETEKEARKRKVEEKRREMEAKRKRLS